MDFQVFEVRLPCKIVSLTAWTPTRETAMLHTHNGNLTNVDLLHHVGRGGACLQAMAAAGTQFDVMTMHAFGKLLRRQEWACVALMAWLAT